MSDKKQNVEKEYPSLHLAFAYAKDILKEQAEIAHSIDIKAGTLWAVATAVIGLGIPLGISKQIMTVNWATMIAAMCLYVAATGLTICILFRAAGPVGMRR